MGSAIDLFAREGASLKDGYAENAEIVGAGESDYALLAIIGAVACQRQRPFLYTR